MATFLVTGGGGFIGSNLVRALLDRGDTVRVLDNFATGRPENLAGLESKITLFKKSIVDPAACVEAMTGCDYVLHQAALPSVPRSVEAPVESNLVNVDGTLNVLEAARKTGVKRLVFAASSSAYGETPVLPKVETMVPDPLSPYAASKLAGESYLKVYYKCYGLETVALRYFNVFGPRQDPKSQYAAVIPRFATAALKGEPATVFGDGQQTRDFCFIENCIEANLLATTAKDAPGKVFNVACGERTSLLETIDLLADIVGKKVAPKHEPGRAGDVKDSLADITQAKKILGYTGKVSFRQGLEKTVEWFRAGLGKA